MVKIIIFMVDLDNHYECVLILCSTNSHSVVHVVEVRRCRVIYKQNGSLSKLLFRRQKKYKSP